MFYGTVSDKGIPGKESGSKNRLGFTRNLLLVESTLHNSLISHLEHSEKPRREEAAWFLFAVAVTRRFYGLATRWGGNSICFWAKGS